MASSNRGVIASAAKQSSIRTPLDCFVAALLAMTIQFQILSHFLHLKINVYLGGKKHKYEFGKS